MLVRLFGRYEILPPPSQIRSCAVIGSIAVAALLVFDE